MELGLIVLPVLPDPPVCTWVCWLRYTKGDWWGEWAAQNSIHFASLWSSLPSEHRFSGWGQTKSQTGTTSDEGPRVSWETESPAKTGDQKNGDGGQQGSPPTSAGAGSSTERNFHTECKYICGCRYVPLLPPALPVILLLILVNIFLLLIHSETMKLTVILLHLSRSRLCFSGLMTCCHFCFNAS